MLTSRDKAEILALQQKIHFLYKQATKRPSGNVCDICCAGDTLGKNGVLYKVRSVVHGYNHRETESPKLCHRHASGWAHSHNAYNWDNKRTDEEIDLHFAEYLANQLRKQPFTQP